jgi:hypothetical protein
VTFKVAILALAVAALGVGGWLGYRATQQRSCFVVKKTYPWRWNNSNSGNRIVCK